MLLCGLMMPTDGQAQTSGSALAPGHLWTKGKSGHTQDPDWVARKLAHQIRRPGKLAPHIGRPSPLVQVGGGGGFPSSWTLDLTYVSQMQEPPVTGIDAAGNPYTDYYMWNFCGPGATAVAMDFWPIPNDRAFGQQIFTDPHDPFITTTWNDTNFRSYLMYLADQVQPPSYSGPGEVTFLDYGNYSSNAYTTFSDLRDAMNWEASGHGIQGNWATYFYVDVGAANLSQDQLMAYIESDLYGNGVPPVVSVNDAYLPDWPNKDPRNGTAHFVAIVGYDNTQGTYTYIETCTNTSCGTSGTGPFPVVQSQLYAGIQDNNGNGGIVW